MTDRASELRSRVLAEVRRTPAPTRAHHRRRTAAVTAAGVLATVVLYFAIGGRGWGVRPPGLIGFTVAISAVAAAGLTRVALGRPRSAMGYPREVLGWLMAGAILVIGLVPAVIAAGWSGAATVDVPGRIDLACGLIALAQGFVPLVTLVVPRRGSDPVHPVLTGAALGLTAGAWAAAIAYVRCPHAAPLHCLYAHAGPAVLLALLGALMGVVFLRVR